MEIKAISPRGYCKGVVRAINIAKETRKQNPDKKITMLGMIVHNKYVVDACKEINILCLDSKGKTRLELLDEVDEGIVIITAHGASEKVLEKAISKGLQVVDATCVDVIKTHNIIKEHLVKGDVLYIGKKSHPEAEGVIAISDRVYLITSQEDINNLPDIKNPLITNQTTMSLFDVENLINSCLKKFPKALVSQEICSATRVRQEAVLKSNDIDCLLVVGDIHSNNSMQLKNMGLKSGVKKAYLIDNANDICLDMLKDCEKIGVTSGASTPTYLTKQVLEVLEKYKKDHILEKVEIDIQKII